MDVLSNATIGKWSVNALGTTADLNAMDYTVAANLPADPSLTAILGQVVFNPANYVGDPSHVIFDPDRVSRRGPLVEQWSILLVWQAGFLALTGLALA